MTSLAYLLGLAACAADAKGEPLQPNLWRIIIGASITQHLAPLLCSIGTMRCTLAPDHQNLAHLKHLLIRKWRTLAREFLSAKAIVRYRWVRDIFRGAVLFNNTTIRAAKIPE